MMRPTETRVGRVDTTTMNKDTRVEDWSGNKEIVSVLTALSISTLGSLVYMRTVSERSGKE